MAEERLAASARAGPAAAAETEEQRRARRKEAARRAWGEGDLGPWSRRLEPAAAHLLAVCGAAPGQRLLDVGAGDGNLAIAAARAAVDVVAVDLSPVLVARGRERSRANAVDVQWDVADVEALPYGDESFDCVASNFGVIYADDPRRALAELERVLRPGGIVALTAWASGGLIGQLLRLAAEPSDSARTGAGPERWGRYETAVLRFSRFEEFEMLDATLRMEFASREEMIGLFTDPPGLLPGADAHAVRVQVSQLAPEHGDETSARPALDADYAVISGRRPAAAPGRT